MSARPALTAAAMLLGTLFVVGCSESISPTIPTGSAAFAVGGGNSDAAHACQMGGYLTLFRTDGTGFATVGDCVSYAAQGGTLATRRTATFTNVLFVACNKLTWGYQLLHGSVVMHDFETKPFGCFSAAAADQTVGFLSTDTLRVFLRDETCSFTFFENGNHALVTGSNPYEVKIADAGGFCEAGPDTPRPPGGALGDPDKGNLNLTKTIS